MDLDLQLACDDYGFLWTRTIHNDFKRPHPSFPSVDHTNPVTKVHEKVAGTGEIDIETSFVQNHYGYVVFTTHEVHEAFDDDSEEERG